MKGNMWKRRLALSGVILIIILYALTIVFALLDIPQSQNFLMASLFCTIVVPVILYAYQLIIRFIDTKKEGTDEE